MRAANPRYNLRRQLGLAAAAAIVAGDILGSGIFFTPGELAAVAQTAWHVYLFWALSGIITLCGALTLAELTSILPRAGATYHIIREAFGSFWAFIKVWIEMWISGPGSVAGVAILFGEFAARLLDYSPQIWGTIGIAVFAVINLLGVQWGGRTQITLTITKISALLLLVFGSLWLAEPATTNVSALQGQPGFLAFFRLVGLGVAAVLFTYDGWIDVTHVAGEVSDPGRNLPRALALGVGSIILLYLLVNFAFLRIVPLEQMRKAPTLISATVAAKTFGPTGATFLNALIAVSILGALGGLVMTLPRLFFAAAAQYEPFFFKILATVSSRTAVPQGSIFFSAITSILALHFFHSFSRIVNFFVVPLQLINILLVASIFKLRNRSGPNHKYRTPAFPVVPLIYIVVMALFLASAVLYRPMDTLMAVALTATGVPVYLWIRKKKAI